MCEQQNSLHSPTDRKGRRGGERRGEERGLGETMREEWEIQKRAEDRRSERGGGSRGEEKRRE